MLTSEGSELARFLLEDDVGRGIAFVFAIHTHLSSLWKSLYRAGVTSARLPHELWIDHGFAELFGKWGATNATSTLRSMPLSCLYDV